MRILLAPMEGVVDHTLRTMLTKQQGIDRCVTEFVRITDQLLPPKVFYRYCPELRNNGKTPSNVPVYIQLLGGKVEPMAMNAERVAALGAAGIDINFGCPAKLVNKNDGGSILLREPKRLFNIVKAVRDHVPISIPVTAKIRLGFEDRSLLKDITQSIVEAGANELTIHARTKLDGYKPPAYWEAIAHIKHTCPIPIIANGEIWSVQDYRHCRTQSGCNDVMLGRGLLACPDLANQIKQQTTGNNLIVQPWLFVLGMLDDFCIVTEQAYEAKYVGNRVKQWLGYLKRNYWQAQRLFEQIKRLKMPQDIAAMIQQHRNHIMENTHREREPSLLNTEQTN